MFQLRKLLIFFLFALSLTLVGCGDQAKPAKVSKFEKWDPSLKEGKGDWAAYDQKERFKYKFCNTIKFRLTLDVNLAENEQLMFSTEREAGWVKEMKFSPKSIVGPKKGPVEVILSFHFPDMEPWGQPPKQAKGDYEVDVQAVTSTTDTDMVEKGRESVKILVNVDN